MNLIDQQGYLVAEPNGRMIVQMSYRKRAGEIVPFRKTIFKKLSDKVAMMEAWQLVFNTTDNNGNHNEYPNGAWQPASACSRLNEDGKVIVGKSVHFDNVDEVFDRFVEYDGYENA